ncbi:hypothetical protein LCGC14_2985730, partial [marine sediment metagenome]
YVRDFKELKFDKSISVMFIIYSNFNRIALIILKDLIFDQMK